MFFLRLLSFTLLSVFGTSITQATITLHGSSTDYHETGGDWLTMGTNDIDSSGGLGTSGFVFFGSFDGASASGQPWGTDVRDLPDYVTNVDAGADFASIADEYPGYGSIDQPTLKDNSNTLGGIAVATGGTAGSTLEVFKFTISGLDAGKTLRVGILSDIEVQAGGNWDPTSITLSDESSTVTVGNHTSSPLTINLNRVNAGWSFFDIDADGTYAVSGTKRLSSQGVGIGGITFDANPPDPLDPPPSTYTLWQSTHWTPVEIADPVISGRYADPDGDGVVNFHEYAFAMNPKGSDSSLSPFIKSVSGGHALSLRQRIGGTGDLWTSYVLDDIRYFAQYSSDLRRWFSGSAWLTQVGEALDNSDGTEQVDLQSAFPFTAEGRAFFRVSATSTDPLKIMCIGDSNTQGNSGAYRLYLQDLLFDAGIGYDFLGTVTGFNASTTPAGRVRDPHHEGFSARRIQEIHTEIQTNGEGGTHILDDLALQPDIVLLMAGTNDMIAGGTNAAFDPGPPLSDPNAIADAPGHFEAMLNDIYTKVPGVHVFVARILPVGPPNGGDNAAQIAGLVNMQLEVIKFNEDFIDRLPANPNINRNGGKLTIVDVFSEFNPNRLKMPSRFHPGTVYPGYGQLAKVWYDALVSAGLAPELAERGIRDTDGAAPQWPNPWTWMGITSMAQMATPCST